MFLDFLKKWVLGTSESKVDNTTNSTVKIESDDAVEPVKVTRIVEAKLVSGYSEENNKAFNYLLKLLKIKKFPVISQGVKDHIFTVDFKYTINGKSGYCTATIEKGKTIFNVESVTNFLKIK